MREECRKVIGGVLIGSVTGFIDRGHGRVYDRVKQGV